ncbi:MAG: peroxiredoxin [Candidatus Andersenbacteria bacterium]|nr:peroxiredoxin [Candidatus Andersenbacteria bacterium]
MLKEGDKAPAFSAPDQDNNMHSLDDYKSEWLLLYFYPRDNTPGCTKEACTFRDMYKTFDGIVNIVGASADSAESHKGFADKHELPFTLLSGKGNSLVQDYGADGLILKKRTSFLIDPEGVIRKVYKNVKPLDHAGQILKDVKELKSA